MPTPQGGIIRKAGGRRELLQRQLAQMSQLEAEARRLRMPPGAAGIPRVGLSNIRLEDPGQAAAAARAAGVGARPQAMIHGGGKYLKPVTPPTATCSHLHVKSGANDKGANTVYSTCDMKSNMPKYDKGQLAAYNAGKLPSWEVLPGHAAQATKAQQCHPTAAATTTAASHRNGGAATRANPSTGGSAASSSNKLPPGHPLLIGGAAAQQQAQTGYWGQPPNHQGCAPECGPQRPALSQLFQRLLRVGRTQMMGSPSKQEDTMMHSMPTQAAHGPISNEPMCPLCRVFMITKVNHSTGAPFWSCPRWPSCTGKLPIQVDRNVQQEIHGIAEHYVVPHAPIAGGMQCGATHSMPSAQHSNAPPPIRPTTGVDTQVSDTGLRRQAIQRQPSCGSRGALGSGGSRSSSRTWSHVLANTSGVIVTDPSEGGWRVSSEPRRW